MGCSEAQMTANRLNAARSTGPRTLEGKERSRRNALKHGLTGAGIVLPTEDVAAIEERFAEFAADLRPRGGVDRFLVRRAALLSVRLDRAALHEAASLTARIEAAHEQQEASEDADAAQFEALLARPAAVRAAWLRDADGVDRLINALLALGAKLAPTTPAAAIDWDAADASRLEAILGHDPGAAPARSRLLSDVALGDFSQLRAAEVANLDPAGKQAWAGARLAAIIDAEVYQLRQLRQQRPTTAAPLSGPAAHRASFDASPEAKLARRYEAATERAFFQTLKEIRTVQAQRASCGEVAPIGLPELGRDLGSFRSPPCPVDPLPPRPAAGPLGRAFPPNREGVRPPRHAETVVIGRPPAG